MLENKGLMSQYKLKDAYVDNASSIEPDLHHPVNNS